MMDMPRERRLGEWFETSPGQDDHEDTEDFIHYLLERGLPKDRRREQDLIEAIRRGDRDGRPFVSRHGSIDLDRCQVRTWAINLPGRRSGRHTVVSIRKVRLGMLLAQVALGVATAMHGQDVYAAVSQILNVIGAFDVEVAHLQPPEAALLTLAHEDSPPSNWQDWLAAANNRIAGWGVGPQLTTRQDLDFWLGGLTSRGIAVEYSGPNNDYIRIRHLVLLVQW